jgi:hypothetical protein
MRPVGLLAVLAGVPAGCFAAGRATVSAGGRPNPIVLERGIPVGVQHTREGALAAADEYLALEQESVERDPARFASLVETDFAPSIRHTTLAAAASDRQADLGGMALWADGGQSFTVIAASRLDRYRSVAAGITSWAGQVFWGPERAPTEAWALARITLGWRNGRWVVRAMRGLGDPAPSPAALSGADPVEQTSVAFSSQLRGFTPVYNRDKFLAYDAFLCGWCLEHPRYKTLATRPIVLFVCRDERAVLGCAKVADAVLTGRVGVMGAPADQWYYASRDHLYFAHETDIHAHRLTAFKLPSLPPAVREKLDVDRELVLEPVSLLPETLVAKAGLRD